MRCGTNGRILERMRSAQKVRLTLGGDPVTLSAYNGFTHKERMEALAWVRREVKSGRRVHPKVCQVCGQTEAVNGHSEDYSQPFGDHIGAFSLCQCCHLMVHFRFQHRERWETYRALIRSGAR